MDHPNIAKVLDAGATGEKTSYDIVTLVPPGTAIGESRVGDMNELNDVGGYYRAELDGTPFPYIYDFLNDDFITLPGTGFVSGVNNHREAVGGSGEVGLYWASPQATPIPLPPLQAGDSTQGNDIKDAGIIIGVSDKRAVLWDAAGVVDLSKAAGRGTGWEKLESALEINGAGSVAGIGIHPIAASGTAAYLLTPK